ncbi:MAG: type II toxin-antitoxin system mRNA interferase toxin, RelE/StbE family [Pseudomonadales bacterium]
MVLDFVRSLIHALISNYARRRECHVEPDWLLIYKLDAGKMIITSEHTC